MARKTVVQFVSDLSGEELGEDGVTLKFGVDGREYEIDLSKDEADGFYHAVNPYLTDARPVRNAGPVRAARRPVAGRDPGRKEEIQRIREWARANGYEVSDRGRIAANVQQAYALAN